MFTEQDSQTFYFGFLFLFYSSLLVCSQMLSLSVICYHQKLDQSMSLSLLHLRCLPFFCIIGVVLVLSFLCNLFIFSQVNVTFRNAFLLVQFLLYFLLVQTTQPQSLPRSNTNTSQRYLLQLLKITSHSVCIRIVYLAAQVIF